MGFEPLRRLPGDVSNPPESRTYIAHVRHKTMGGEPTHADTHPFAREMGGRDYCFAHNGTLDGPAWDLPLGHHRPLGETDSERFFCHLLREIAARGGLFPPRIASEMGTGSGGTRPVPVPISEANGAGKGGQAPPLRSGGTRPVPVPISEANGAGKGGQAPPLRSGASPPLPARDENEPVPDARGGHLDDLESWRWLHETLASANRFGKLNVLLSDGRRLFVYHDVNGWKGLNFRKVHVLDGHPRHFGDETLSIDLGAGSLNHGFVVATCPLSPTGWHSFRLGELIVFERGSIRFSSHRERHSPEFAPSEAAPSIPIG